MNNLIHVMVDNCFLSRFLVRANAEIPRLSLRFFNVVDELTDGKQKQEQRTPQG